jgi:uncharacterized protein YndB with AHSA1/START domain
MTTTALVVRRIINAAPDYLFELWTRPEHVKVWWGPESVICTAAEIDLRVGGRYRIANELPDGATLWIVGEFEVIAPPHKLVFTWQLEPGPERTERVTVRFEPRAGGTEVVVVHERIAEAAAREGHEKGWIGCLTGLAEYVECAAQKRG